MDSSSCGAPAYMLGARFGVRVADGQLTFLGRMRLWRMLAAAVATLATHPMRANATGDCRDHALRGDRTLIKNILPTVLITVLVVEVDSKGN
jgi:hypothetical protein